MTKRNPDKREQNRLKKIEDEKKNKRLRAAMMYKDGRSSREIGKMLGVSHQFVIDWAKKLLVKKTMHVKKDRKKVPANYYELRKGYKKLLATKKPGPKPGRCPKVDEIMDKVVATKKEEFNQKLGAKKIGILSKVDASAPTVAKALERAKFKPMTKPRARHNKRFCMRHPNKQWDIDFVKVGVDRITRKNIEALTVLDDHSRMSFSSAVTTEATTDFVIDTLEMLFNQYGKPEIIHSDHGCQWYSVSGGVSRFDDWCESLGIEHTMAAIRTPEENGKVERLHGSYRREMDLPPEGDLQTYGSLLERYRVNYNMKRPHQALDYRTPFNVYYKTYPNESIMLI